MYKSNKTYSDNPKVNVHRLPNKVQIFPRLVFSLKFKQTRLYSDVSHLKSARSNNNYLGSYVAGLIEGDGSFIFRKGECEKISPAIIFTFHYNELRMYEKLKFVLGSGNIYKEKSGICRYQITNAQAVINVINMVNGYFRTPKIHSLYKAIYNINKWHNSNIIKPALDVSNLSGNA